MAKRHGQRLIGASTAPQAVLGRAQVAGQNFDEHIVLAQVVDGANDNLGVVSGVDDGGTGFGNDGFHGLPFSFEDGIEGKHAGVGQMVCVQRWD